MIHTSYAELIPTDLRSYDRSYRHIKYHEKAYLQRAGDMERSGGGHGAEWWGS